jgi:hypothetical protein
MTLNGKTPAEISGIVNLERNKWQNLIKKATSLAKIEHKKMIALE